MGDISLARSRPLFAVVAALLSVACGVWIGYQVFAPAVVVETPAPAVDQKDGSVVVERAPDAKAKPKHLTPRGAKVERIVQIEARGAGLQMPTGETKPCPPVTLDLSLVREKDGGKRVVASSLDGEILRAIDIPVETAAAPEEPKRWAAGLSWSPTNETLGVWVERDVWRVRAGAEINQVRRAAYGPADIEARVRVGVTF